MLPLPHRYSCPGVRGVYVSASCTGREFFGIEHAHCTTHYKKRWPGNVPDLEFLIELMPPMNPSQPSNSTMTNDGFYDTVVVP
jgi:hypothetical protein